MDNVHTVGVPRRLHSDRLQLLGLVAAGLLALAAPAWLALLLGIAMALVFPSAWNERAAKGSSATLKLAVVGLGAGVNLTMALRVGLEGMGFAVAGITLALTVGYFAGRKLKVAGDVAWLIAVGTSICGGSAIAAAAPALAAKREDTSAALATVFLLNAVALLVFPMLGRAFELDATQFGRFCALAIHDTSSVVGAASAFGSESLEVATVTKLARALFIVPVTATMAIVSRSRKGRAQARGGVNMPWFILGFVAVAALFTFAPPLAPIGLIVTKVSKVLFCGALFLVGLGFTRGTLSRLGLRPLVLGVLLWTALSVGTLTAIKLGVVV